MATVISGHTSNFYSANARCKMQFSIEDSGSCSNGKRVLNYRIDRGLTRNVGGYYDGAYTTGSTMTWFVNGYQQKQWEWSVNWPYQRWPASGDWWLDYQTGSFKCSQMNGTYTVTMRWKAYGWSSAAFDLSGSLYVGGCCTSAAPTGISGWVSNVQAFKLTNNGSITGWGTECTSSTTRNQESTVSTYNKRYYDYRDLQVVGTNKTTTTMSYTHTGLTPNTKYYLDACFRNKSDLWATYRVNDIYQYSTTTSLESPSARITYLDSRSIQFNWSQKFGGKASGGTVYYYITKRGESTSVSGSTITCGSFTTSTSGTSFSGSRDTWTDDFRLTPSTEYDLWVWSYNVRKSVITKISFTTDRASTPILEKIEDKVQSSVTLVTRRQSACNYDRGTSQITSNVNTGQLYITTATNPDAAPGGFGKKVTYPQGFWSCRYIRLQMGRSNVDANAYILKWKVINTAGTDVANGRTTISGWTNSTNVTNTNYSNYASTSTSAWLTLDLGSIQTIWETIIYPYYDARNNQNTTSSTVLSNTRGFRDLNIEISTDGTTWKRVYSSGSGYTVATYANMKADGTAPGTGQSESNLYGYRVVPDSPSVATTISNLNKNSLAITNKQRVTPGQTYNITATMVDRHYSTGWYNIGKIEFPVARRIKPDGSIIDYRLWRIRPNGQKFKMTGSIIDRSQD